MGALSTRGGGGRMEPGVAGRGATFLWRFITGHREVPGSQVSVLIYLIPARPVFTHPEYFTSTVPCFCSFLSFDWPWAPEQTGIVCRKSNPSSSGGLLLRMMYRKEYSQFLSNILPAHPGDLEGPEIFLTKK